jgi:hypothetical protein
MIVAVKPAFDQFFALLNAVKTPVMVGMSFLNETFHGIVEVIQCDTVCAKKLIDLIRFQWIPEDVEIKQRTQDTMLQCDVFTGSQFQWL